MAEEEVEETRPAIPPNAWFYKRTPLAELLKDVPRIENIDDLAIEGLTPEEAQAFLQAIEE